MLFRSTLAGYGYSGRGLGYNSAVECAVEDVGPTPPGTYTIGPSFTHALAGPVTMRLTPSPETDMHGWSGFMVHGDSTLHAANPTADNSASHGCIVLGHAIRLEIDASTDRVLIVTV